MKSLIAALAPAAAAVTQAMGLYLYFTDTMAISGMVFFPILFALMGVYLVWRNKGSERFSAAHTILMVLGVLGLIGTVIGKVATVYWLYPSVYVYYAMFLLVVLEVAFCIAGLPKKEKKTAKKPSRAPRRRQAPGRGPTNLVARPKNTGSQHVGSQHAEASTPGQPSSTAASVKDTAE